MNELAAKDSSCVLEPDTECVTIALQCLARHRTVKQDRLESLLREHEAVANDKCWGIGTNDLIRTGVNRKMKVC